MTPAVRALLAEFESAAKTAQAAEADLRKRMAGEIARLERQRAFAFRRTRLIRALTANAGAAEPEAAWGLQRQAVRDELGWTEDTAAYDAILARLQPLALAVWKCSCADGDDAPPAVVPELEAFEAWFEDAHGKSFYALFDQYVTEVPVVDF